MEVTKTASPTARPCSQKSQLGATLLDHTLVVALVAVVCIGSVTEVRHGVLKSFCGMFANGAQANSSILINPGSNPQVITQNNINAYYQRSSGKCSKYKFNFPGISTHF
jgi:Flp pilus assembly pilin Flp